jgi:hypothetical protein
VRNHKPKQWIEDEVQTLIKVINAGSTAIEIATELGRYIASVAGDIGLLLRSERGAAETVGSPGRRHFCRGSRWRVCVSSSGAQPALPY